MIEERQARLLTTLETLMEVGAEREAQDRKWGQQDHGVLYWLGILVEEVGEAAKAMIEIGPGVDANVQLKRRVREEMIQVAAVAVACIENIDRR